MITITSTKGERTARDFTPLYDLVIVDEDMDMIVLPVNGGRCRALEVAENLKKIIEVNTTETVVIEDEP